MAKIENNNFKKFDKPLKKIENNKIKESNILGKDILNKESKVYFILAVCSVVVVLGGLIFYLYVSIEKDVQPPVEEKSLVERQTEALEALKRDAEPLTEEEIKEQSEALEKADIKSLTEEDIQRQTEALENLR